MIDELYLDGGGDPSLQQVDTFLKAHFAARALNVETLAAKMHELDVGQALHEDYWAMRYPSGTEGKGAECPPCVAAARSIIE